MPLDVIFKLKTENKIQSAKAQVSRRMISFLMIANKSATQEGKELVIKDVQLGSKARDVEAEVGSIFMD